MKKCPACNIVWEQCRCPDPAKESTVELCPKCKAVGCKAPLTKIEKVRQILKREMDRSLLPGLMSNLNQHAPYIKKLKQYPDFLPKMVDELVELQVPYYMTVSDEVIDAAHTFFTTPAGDEWCKFAGTMTNRINVIFQGFLGDLIKRLDALEVN
jgi:hypothetical protein